MSKMSKINKWADRYYVLQGPVLYYYLKNTDTEPKGTLVLQEACKVSDIRSDVNKKRKQFVFSIIWPAEQETDDHKDGKDADKAGDGGDSSPSKHKSEKQSQDKKRFLGRGKGKDEVARSLRRRASGKQLKRYFGHRCW